MIWMLAYLMLSLKFTFFSFSFLLFYLGDFMTLSFISLTCSSTSANQMLIPYSVFFIAVFVLSSDCSFYISCLFVEVLTELVYSFPKFIDTLITSVLNSLSYWLLVSVHVVLFLRFYPVLSFGTHFCVSSFWLSLCVFLWIRQNSNPS